ncbi:MAG: CRISPR-associated helicase Cas3 [Pseudomonadota bacterium]
MAPAVAHVRNNSDESYELHSLEEHLREVAKLANKFAELFGSGDWAYLAGLWHDLGKYRPRFQHYIRQASGYDVDAHIEGKPGKAPHSTAGALLACDKLKGHGRILAYLIAGHHAGLANWHSVDGFPGLKERLGAEKAREELDEALIAQPPAYILAAADDFRPDLRRVPGLKEGFALWVRMLFSCLVDADFLDTEFFMNEGQAEMRGGYPGIAALLEAFDRHMGALAVRLTESGSLSPVNQLRADILRQCRAKAAEPPGLFSLTVPTGGGKTLSSLAFALEHAHRHSQQRVIYVIPYTSIIEQTADVFREIFHALKPDPVVEHHSNAEADESRENHKSRLACENWDAALIVTTSVQFFESLFAARTSRCRKLHNLVNSVVVLDEAQLLPPEFLQPILDALNLLTRHYGVTVVLSTATQPALSTREYFDPAQNLRGLDGVRELMADGPFIQTPDELYKKLKRVEVTLPTDWHTPVSWEALAAELQAHDSVLFVVNRRRDARDLFKLMPEGTLHLSALMCGAHRSDVIRHIKEKLKVGEPVRVISTPIIDCGVDVDFPVVYRALSGLDSLAQSAGRCNREGRMDEAGKVVVFVPPAGKLPDLVNKGVQATISTLHDMQADPLDRALFGRYFEQFYYASDLDRHDICGLLKLDDPNSLAINFRSAADRFRLIQDEDGVPVIVRYQVPGDRTEALDILLNKLRKDGPERWLMRKLQRYTVTAHRREVQRWAQLGDVEEWQPGLYVQVCEAGYSERLGMVMGDEEQLYSAVLIG